MFLTSFVQKRREYSGIDEDRSGDEHGHDEGAPPAEELGQGATKKRSEGEASVNGGGIEPDRIPPLTGRVEVRDQGYAVCIDHRTADSLDEPKEEEHADRGRKDGEEGADGVDHDPGHEDGDPSPGVAEPPRREEEDDRREEVSTRDPGERGGIGGKFSPDGGQGEIDGGAGEGV